MSRIDRIALLVSLAAIMAAAFVSYQIFQNMPHIEDEMAFTWQAKVIARGQLTVATPKPCANCYMVPFVVDYNGLRFGKYPLGWPVLLAFGEFFHARGMVNPLLAGLATWFTYLLGKKLKGEITGLLSAILTATSPFFLMNSGSLLSHPWSLTLAQAFCQAWLDAFGPPNLNLPEKVRRSLPVAAAGLSMAGLALTRPLTAVAVAVPFAAHGLYLLVRADAATRKRLLVFGLLTGSLAILHFAWQFAVTGNPLINPYTLWWPYDTIGFGLGVGLQKNGYLPIDAWLNAMFSLSFGASDLFGWPGISWLFMPFGFVAILRDQRLRQSWGIWLMLAVLPALILAYGLYWIGSWVYGPRYYYEGLFSAVILTALGMQWLAGPLPRLIQGRLQARRFPWQARPVLRFVSVSALASLLVIGNLWIYTPSRLSKMVGMYKISRDCQLPFQLPMAQQAIPALVFVHVEQRWVEYGCMIDLTSPFMDSDFVIAISRGYEMDEAVAKTLPRRHILHYYPDTRRFSLTPRDVPPQ
jgi:hypothetical protein